MNRSAVLLLLSVIAAAALFWSLMSGDRPVAQGPGNSGETQQASAGITLFCAASNRAVMDEIIAAYAEETGRTVQVQYGPTQALLSSLRISGGADLFLPADDSFAEAAREQGLIAESLPLARMRPVIAVAEGNPLQILQLDDLLRSDVRLNQASPDSAAIGRVIRNLLQAEGRWESLRQNTAAFRPTVTEVANDVLIGAADAGIVYDAVLHTYPKLESVPCDDFSGGESRIVICVTADTEQPAAALHFARYAAAVDRGLKHYADHGFRTEPGEEWADVPQLSFFAGSMLRPAIDETISRFEEREGVRVHRIYNGCGILVAQMRSGQIPDAYFACDTEFMNQVPDLFPESVDVSKNELVILVPEGNPNNIAGLRDLTREGLRVGVGHEKQCAMGWLTQNTLREGRLQQEVMQNVTVQSPTGDMLVNQLKAGSLDAAVAYLSNAAGSGDVLDAVRIEGLDCAVATQPLAVSTSCRFPQTTRRLFELLMSEDSRGAFTAKGFGWAEEDSRERSDERSSTATGG